MKLLQVDTLDQARKKIKDAFGNHEMATEMIPLCQAGGRVLAEDVCASENIPGFYRSSVDGYAVCAKDTAGATESIPVFLEIVEEISIGSEAKKPVKSGQCSYVPTGGMIPDGADAMVMVEYSELFDENHVAVYQSAPFGKSVVVPGEDVRQGQVVLKSGTVIGPAQAGALAAVGKAEVLVFVPWKIAILSTGDELVAVERTPGPGQVRDINTWALNAFARSAGLETVMLKVLPDKEDLLTETLRQAMEISDLVLTSGGSSQGKKDMTNEILDLVSDGGVFTHGLALKPGKPTILGYDKRTDTLLCGLPGHPVAALTVFQLLVIWLWKELTGQKGEILTAARMATNLASAPGKTTCLLVRLTEREDGYWAEPVLGKSGMITTMSQADGYVIVDMNREGLKQGDLVTVCRFG